MLRAIRLVVDTGFHSKHWSRQQVVDYFHNHSAIDQPEVQSETDRYMAWPAQALGYKIGQLEILKSASTRKTNWTANSNCVPFTMKCFGGGALPMDVLSARIYEWVGQPKAQSSLSLPSVKLSLNQN